VSDNLSCATTSYYLCPSTGPLLPYFDAIEATGNKLKAKPAMDLGTTRDFKANNVIAIKRISNVSGLISGTTVMTTGGAIPVENLKVGDNVVNPDMSTAVLRDIHITVAAITSVIIKAGALGHTCPQRDLVLGPDTLVHIRDWRAQALFQTDAAIVKAKRLIDGEFILNQPVKSLTVYELVFDNQHLLYADGLEIASTPI